MQARSHTIVRLPVHLPRLQPVYFNEGNKQSLQTAFDGPTQLTAWFTLNQNVPEARSLLYTQVTNHYRFAGERIRRKGEQNGEKSLRGCTP